MAVMLADPYHPYTCTLYTLQLHSVIKPMCDYFSITALIDANNVVFLCELLDEIGRKDLTDEVKSYIVRIEGTYGQTCLKL